MGAFRKYILILFILSSCSDDENIGAVKYARIQSEVHNVYLGSGNSLKLKARAFDDQDQPVILTNWQHYANGIKISSNFQPKETGKFQVWAQKGTIHTDTIEIEARATKQYDWFELEVIFHVVNLPDLDKNLITDSFSHANDAFSNKLGSINPNAQSPFIKLKAAEVTPGGEPLSTAGVIHEQNLPDSISPKDFGNVVKARQWNPDRYINVWVTEVYPNAYSDFARLDCGTELHGLLCLDESVTYVRSGIYLMPSQLGYKSDTFIHELGHVLGLLHVFTTRCEQDADFCDDTPVYDYDKYVNRPPSKTCDNQYFTQDNHMDYTDAPSYSFTYDQVERMRYVLQYGRYVGNRRGLVY